MDLSKRQAAKRCPRCGGGPGDPSCGKSIHMEWEEPDPERGQRLIKYLSAPPGTPRPKWTYGDPPKKQAASGVDQLRDEKGRLPAFAWPGGYPIIYVTSDGEVMCADCASGENGSQARTVNGPDDNPRDGWFVNAYDVYYEGPPEHCVHCGTEIESAYGDPDAPEEEPV